MPATLNPVAFMNPQPLWRIIAGNGLLAVAYFLAARLGLALAFAQAQVSPIWPPTGLALAALIRFGPGWWPGIFLGAFTANFLAAEPLLTAVGVAAGNTLEALAGAWLLRRGGKFRDDFGRIRDVWHFIGFAALLAPVISATVGGLSLGLGGVMPWGDFVHNWQTWWLGDALGALIVAPVLLTWSRRKPLPIRPLMLLEAAALGSSVVAVSWFAFSGGVGFRFLVFPPLIWAALRFGPSGATLAMVATAIIAIWHTVHLVVPFASELVSERLHGVQIFASVAALTVLFLAAVKREREHAREQLRRHRDDLEAQVAARTAEVEHSRAQLQDILDNASDLIQSVDNAGHYGFVNRAWCETLGYTLEEAAGLTIFDVIAPEEHEHCREAFVRLLATGEPLRIETQFRAKDGRLVPVEGHVNLRQEAGRLGTTRGVFRNITERKQAEDSLRKSEARWKLAITASKDGIWDLDLAGRRVFVSPQAKAMIGYAADELPDGLNIWGQLVHPEDRAQLSLAFKRHLRRETTVFECEHRLRAKDGDYRWILTRGAALFDDRGRPLRMLGAFTDITPRRHAQELELSNLAREKELNEMKSRFVALASHELRTPLAAFSLGVELLHKHWTRFTPEKIEKNLQTITSSVQHLRGILDDLLLLGQSEEGRMRCRPVTVDLPGFCRKLTEDIQAVDRSRHPFEWDFSLSDPEVSLDPQLLRHILTNLLSNACKYSPEGRFVKCRAAVTSDQIVLTVADNGIGIPLEDQPRLFDFFFRAGNVGGIPGTGLGLLVVQRCVTAHGGRIEFTSTPGQGTCFTVTLPLASL